MGIPAGLPDTPGTNCPFSFLISPDTSGSSIAK
jgi:hypothetical protein